ncbi:hypothetical protein FPZ43_04085 [Mucilaginibacter pallidiroseus]|uniref:Uncharacterized protein n=1 Tax=Mucilaginibacter pallidiroseus TaxID=2599295 RepID=A0A563UK58_9SPHI|nr:hypothetical protein [Mucilaginibacter pallidiroseus]TWR31658.1 hypothetical protein FPZ43_04085 [Mucilaginibacter pallidiroseus]
MATPKKPVSKKYEDEDEDLDDPQPGKKVADEDDDFDDETPLDDDLGGGFDSYDPYDDDDDDL